MILLEVFSTVAVEVEDFIIFVVLENVVVFVADVVAFVDIDHPKIMFYK